VSYELTVDVVILCYEFVTLEAVHHVTQSTSRTNE